MQSDAQVIEEVLTGRREAFADLVGRYERAVHAVAMGVLRDHHAAQDVSQETFVAAYRGLAALRQPGSFGSWILRMARNEALTFVRRKRPEQFPGALPEAAAHEGNGRLDDRAERLLTAVMELGEHEQTVVVLRYFAGYSLDEISEMTGQPFGTVGAQLSRARARLRERLEEVRP
jgi:RNA polymerase sigma-70 factor, ECF subfamily